ncbi:MAG TPA: hypothetical protein VJV78_32090 [Polyangiales bacterium]|nr:hypothetical protein [Polyangiales bacterium]
MMRFWRRLEGERAALWLALFAVIFSLRALWLPLEMDDHWFRLNHARGPLHMLGSAEPHEIPAAKASGDLGWGVSEHFQLRFFRPLSSFSHWLDLTLWPNAVWAMHAINVLIYVALVMMAACSYRLLPQVIPVPVPVPVPDLRARPEDEQPGTGASTEVRGPPLAAALAGLAFALDDAHGSSVGWISGRNTLLAATFGLAAFYFYLRRSWAGPLSLALGFLSGEGALQACCYLLAHALVLDRRLVRARARSLAPYAVVVLIWASWYLSQGYGVRNSGWYRTPSLSSFFAWLWDLPLWLGGTLVASFATLSLLFDGAITRVIWIGALALVAPPLIAAVRHSRLARFYALGTLLCCLPLLTTRPQDRLLLFASFGAAGWLGECLAMRASLPGYARRAATGLGVLHLGLSPLLYPAQLGQTEPIERSSRELACALHAVADSSQVVVVNLPFDVFHSLARSQLRAAGAALPVHSHVLYAGSSELQVQRTDARTLLVHAHEGWFADSYERLLVSLDPGFKVDQHWQLSGMRVEIAHVDARRAPNVVRFVFPTPLEDPTRHWLQWRGQHPEVWKVPAIGKTVSLPALSPLRSLSPRARMPPCQPFGGQPNAR